MFVVWDIGGTKIRMGISWDGGTVEEVRELSTPEKFEEGTAEMEKVVKEFAQKEPVTAAGGGIAGVLDEKKNKLLASPNLPGWVGKPVGEKLKKILGCPVVLDNDAALAALGEARVGAGRRTAIVAYVTISTGIGGAKVVDGEVEERAFGFEPGHQIIAADGEVKYFEDFASGTALAKLHGKPAEEIEEAEAWEQETRLLAIGLHNVVVMWSPEMLILGGSVGGRIDMEKLAGYMQEQMKMFPKLPTLVGSELGDKAGMTGALIRLTKGRR